MQILINGIAAGSIFALVAVSVSLVALSCRFVNFAIAGKIAGGAFIYYYATRVLQVGVVTGWLAATVSMAALAILSELALFKWLRFRMSSGETLLIASLGLLVVFEAVGGLVAGHEPLIARTGPVESGLTVVDAKLSYLQGLSVVSAVVLLLVIFITLRYTSLGRYLRSLAADPELARALALPVDGVVIGCAALSGALAGYAGVLIALDQEATVTMGFRPLLLGVSVMAVTGSSNLNALVVTAWLLGVVQQLVGTMVGGAWQDPVIFGIMIIALVVRPRGLFSRASG